MAGQGLSPRQKMINMLYLVLLALLALNVSAEVLRAFYFVNQGLEQTRTNLEHQNDLLYERFRQALEDDPEAVQENYDKAQLVRERSTDMVERIESLKNEMIEIAGGRKDDGDGPIRAADNLDISSRFMVSDGRAEELQQEILDLREFYYEQLGITEEEYDLTLNAQDPPPRPDEVNPSWERTLFYYTPVAGAVTNLSKLQTDVRNTEADVVDRLLRTVYDDHIQFDEVSAQIIPNSNHIMVGEEFRAEIFLSAFSSTQEPEIYIEGERLTSEQIESGKGIFTERPTTEGPKTYEGYIQLPNTEERREFSISYQAFQPAAIISADAMNLMYVGLENPISVSVPGYPTDQVQARITNGQLHNRPGDGKYYVTLSEGMRETVISAFVETEDGMKRMGERDYRIRPLPRPEASLNGNTEGEISRGEASLFQHILVRLGEGFAFEGINYNVQSYRFMHEPRRGDPFQQRGTGRTLSPQMQNRFQNASSGDVFIITEIDAQGPDGVVRANGITLTIR